MYIVWLYKGLVMSTALFFAALETGKNARQVNKLITFEGISNICILLILPEYPIRL